MQNILITNYNYNIEVVFFKLNIWVQISTSCYAMQYALAYAMVVAF